MVVFGDGRGDGGVLLLWGVELLASQETLGSWLMSDIAARAMRWNVRTRQMCFCSRCGLALEHSNGMRGEEVEVQCFDFELALWRGSLWNKSS